MLSVGSLFAGIGGFDLGLERAGMRTVWQVEQDEFCRAVLAQHFPHAVRHEDVCLVGANELEPVDLICGGFPCQDLSIAGKGAGIDGARSGLWSEYARIVGELRPRYVVVENVAALLARGLGRVLGDLAALGYDAEWDCIPAAAVGAPHLRDRLWLVAYPGGERAVADPKRERGAARREAGNMAQAPRGSQGVAHSEREQGGERHNADVQRRRTGEAEQAGLGGSGSRALADAECQGLQGRAGGGQSGAGRASGESAGIRQGLGGQWLPEPDVGRVAHGVPARVDRLRSLGNALVPQIAEWIGCRILEWEGGVEVGTGAFSFEHRASVPTCADAAEINQFQPPQEGK